MCATGRDSDEVWVFTSRTVVTVARAVAKKKAAANAANAMRRRMTLPPKNSTRNANDGSSGLDHERRNFTVEPSLLIGQGRPRLSHTQIAFEGRLALRALRKL